MLEDPKMSPRELLHESGVYAVLHNAQGTLHLVEVGVADNLQEEVQKLVEHGRWDDAGKSRDIVFAAYYVSDGAPESRRIKCINVRDDIQELQNDLSDMSRGQ